MTTSAPCTQHETHRPDLTSTIPAPRHPGHEHTTIPAGEDSTAARHDEPATEPALASTGAELVALAQAGDQSAAFDLVYRKYAPTVFRFIYFRVRNGATAEDLMQDTFVRAMKRLHYWVDQGRDLGAWIITIARNLVADFYKSGRYRLEVTVDMWERRDEEVAIVADPVDYAVASIQSDALRAAVKALIPDQMTCVALRFFSGYSVEETAYAMGKTIGAVKALQCRAVKTLRRMMPDFPELVPA